VSISSNFLLSSLTQFSIYGKQTALLNVYVLFLCLYKIYILIILLISMSISISWYFQNIISISDQNWNPDIESSPV